MEFQKELYFTMAEACKQYNISRAQFRKICNRNKIELVENEVTYKNVGDEDVIKISTVYVKKIDFIRANI